MLKAPYIIFCAALAFTSNALAWESDTIHIINQSGSPIALLYYGPDSSYWQQVPAPSLAPGEQSDAAKPIQWANQYGFAISYGTDGNNFCKVDFFTQWPDGISSPQVTCQGNLIANSFTHTGFDDWTWTIYKNRS